MVNNPIEQNNNNKDKKIPRDYFDKNIPIDRYAEKLHRACYLGDIVKVSKLVSKENVNTQNERGYTPIQTAMLGQKHININTVYTAIAMLLMEYGANPFKSENPAHPAAIEIFSFSERLLLLQQKNIEDGVYPLSSLEGKKIILRQAQQAKSKSGLATFATATELDAFWNNYTDEDNIPVLSETEKLHRACYLGDIETVLHIANEENVNSTDKDGFTPIQISMMGLKNVRHNIVYVIIGKALMEYGANPFHSTNLSLPSATEMAPWVTDSFLAHQKNMIECPKILTHPLLVKSTIQKALATKNYKDPMTFKTAKGFINYWNNFNNER